MSGPVDYVERAREQLALEAAASLEARVADRARKLQLADAGKVQALPNDPGEAAAALAVLQSRYDALTRRQELARRNPMITTSAADDVEIPRLRSQIETIERHLDSLRRLAS